MSEKLDRETLLAAAWRVWGEGAKHAAIAEAHPRSQLIASWGLRDPSAIYKWQQVCATRADVLDSMAELLVDMTR